nr:PREDICTED: metallo-beta-lactamase domain-containing protein 1 [Bemisia tabaci]XP_018897533.1 PREDICTED: metallo-beta-lactamase domain-containing protein 1 [Bemisia tabaci]XP_018897534.1 PREDICTED: metallo-beta-lactamase domain-containing protein 1 [Bemisia tabaci]XP_018897536.1 PREDICTED: metallo-beta-lactamase domain-containing protein 1 [Bemisia tabaci]XP_018897537.1 PREDICTED: metallo-beta-lactamase domain-containing protein 1 [Bemisia tabaci]XP_018897538.1 PREDICTED: metallo-beta-lactam
MTTDLPSSNRMDSFISGNKSENDLQNSSQKVEEIKKEQVNERNSDETDFRVTVLYPGYSKSVKDGMIANCSCTLITGCVNVIVDTMTPWDQEKIIRGLELHGLQCKDINYVVCTHGHSDHIGNNNLFLNATQIVGFCISHKDFYFTHDFEKGDVYKLNERIQVIPTPGHTLSDVSVIVKTKDKGVIAIVGDLFENEFDLNDESIWLDAGSENADLQRENRKKILEMADYIIPGHGSMFKNPRSSINT